MAQRESTAIFQTLPCLKNEEKQKPRFLLFAGQDAPMPQVHDRRDAGGRATPGAVAEGCAEAAVL